MSQQENRRPGGQPQCPRQRNYRGVFTEQEGSEGSGLSRERGSSLGASGLVPMGPYRHGEESGFYSKHKKKPLGSSNQNNTMMHVLFTEDPSGRWAPWAIRAVGGGRRGRWVLWAVGAVGGRVGTRKASRDATDSSGREGSRRNTFGFRASHWPRAVLCAISGAARLLHRHPSLPSPQTHE